MSASSPEKIRPRWLNRTVFGIGGLLSSIIVGVLWTAFGTGVAFACSAVLFSAGALLVCCLPRTSAHPAVR